MDTDNVRSRRVAERLGYTLEATLRQAFATPDGAPSDVHVFGLLPEQYRALPWVVSS
jgi:RimJ/RimL family protein N-acetyltransferase